MVVHHGRPGGPAGVGGRRRFVGQPDHHQADHVDDGRGRGRADSAASLPPTTTMPPTTRPPTTARPTTTHPHPPDPPPRPTHRPPSRPPPSRRPGTAIPPTRTHACMMGSGITTARVGPGTVPTTLRVRSGCCRQTRSAWTATTTGSAASADADPQAGRGAPSLGWWEGAWMRSAGCLSYEYRELRERVYAPNGRR